jgi:hypothetical protein
LVNASRRVLAAGLLVAVTAVVAVIIASTRSSGERIMYPLSLPGGYGVAASISGEEAVRSVQGLHWNPEKIRVKDAVVVQYSDGTILWAAYVGKDACKLADTMAEKMAVHEAELPYTAPILHSIGGHRVYLSMDKRDGGLHAFWCRDGLVAWVRLGASASTDPVQVLGLFIEGVKTG